VGSLQSRIGSLMFPSNTETIATITLIALSLVLGFVLSKRFGLAFWPFVAVLFSFVALGGSRLFPEVTDLLEQPDETFYLSWGRQLAAFWVSGAPVEVPYLVWPGSGAWSVLIGLATVMLGPVAFFMIVVNAVLVSFSFLFLQQSASLLFNFKTHWISLLVFMSNPALILNGPSLLREGAFWFGSSLLVLGLTLVSRSSLMAGLIALLLGSGVILAVRPNLGVFVVFLFLISTTITWIWVHRKSGKQFMAIGLGILSVLLILFPFGIDSLAGRDDLPSYAEAAAQELSDSASTGFHNSEELVCTSNEYLATACLSLSNLPNFLFGPFVWEMEWEPFWLVLLASTWHFLFILGISSTTLFTRSLRQPALFALFITGAALTLLLATTLTNYGIVARFRTLIWLLLLPPAWAGLERLQRSILGRIRK
jgi:hypothetical protein